MFKIADVAQVVSALKVGVDEVLCHILRRDFQPQHVPLNNEIRKKKHFKQSILTWLLTILYMIECPLCIYSLKLYGRITRVNIKYNIKPQPTSCGSVQCFVNYYPLFRTSSKIEFDKETKLSQSFSRCSLSISHRSTIPLAYLCVSSSFLC